MKKHQVKEYGVRNPDSGPDLRFTHCLLGGHQRLVANGDTPDEWESVIHLYDDVFLAEDANGLCCVYVGTYEPETETTEPTNPEPKTPKYEPTEL